MRRPQTIGGRSSVATRVKRPITSQFGTPSMSTGPPWIETFDKADSAGWAFDLVWDQFADDPATVSGEATGDDSSHPGVVNAGMRIVAETLTVDQYIEVTLASLVAINHNWNVNLVLRATNVSIGTLNHYACQFEGAGNDIDGSVDIYKYVAGSATTLVNNQTTVLAAPGDVLRFEVSGTSLTAKINGSTVATTTDSSITTGKRGGLLLGWNQLGNSLSVDNLELGDL